MDFTKFIQQFKVAKDKEAFVKKHIVKQYISYGVKLTLAHSIAKTCTHISIDGKDYYKKDTPAQYFTTIMQLVKQYTDIAFEDSNIAAVYDALMEVGALSSILASIPESEVAEFRALVDMCVSDIYDNERDITSFLETKFEAINLSVEQIMNGLTEAIGAAQNNITEFPMDNSEEDK